MQESVNADLRVRCQCEGVDLVTISDIAVISACEKHQSGLTR